MKTETFDEALALLRSAEQAQQQQKQQARNELDCLVGACFKLAKEARISTVLHPDFHVALDSANRFLRHN